MAKFKLKINLRIISKPYAYLQQHLVTISVNFQENQNKTRRSCTHKVPTIYSLYQEIKREITLTEWAPSPLNLHERKNIGLLNTNHIYNFKILALTVPDQVLSVTHASQTHGQTQTNMPPQLLRSWGHKNYLSNIIKYSLYQYL